MFRARPEAGRRAFFKASLPRIGAALCLWAWAAFSVSAAPLLPEAGPDARTLAAYDVVIMGEVHDNPVHHENQAAWVAAQGPAALVFEMLTPALAVTANGMRGAPRELMAEALSWETRGWPDFDFYAPIFEAAPDAAIFGGDPGREAVRRAVREGAASAFGPDAALFELGRPLPPEMASERIAEQAEAHCGLLPEALLPGMVEAQRLRDASLARAVIAAMTETGGPVAVITGTGHARRDVGIPAALAVAAPELKVLAIGQGEEAWADGAPFDAQLSAPAPARGDPCDSLR